MVKLKCSLYKKNTGFISVKLTKPQQHQRNLTLQRQTNCASIVSEVIILPENTNQKTSFEKGYPVKHNVIKKEIQKIRQIPNLNKIKQLHARVNNLQKKCTSKIFASEG